MSRKSDKSESGWLQLQTWISKYLQDKTNPMKVIEWQGWAHRKVESGWTHEQVRNRIEAAWLEHCDWGTP